MGETRRKGRVICVRGGTRLLVAATLVSLAAGALATDAAGVTGDSVLIDKATTLTAAKSQTLSIAIHALPTCSTATTTRNVSVVLDGPAGVSSAVDSIAAGTGPCQQEIDLVVEIPTPGLNGKYVFKLTNGATSGPATAALNVVIPPVAVRKVKVTTAGDRATFTWMANPEKDITGYDVLASSRQVIAHGNAAKVCTAKGRCQKTVNLGSAVAGRHRTYSVRAVRCGLTCHAGVDGPTSSDVTASFAKAPVVHPSPSPSVTETATEPATSTPTPVASTPTSSGPGVDNHPSRTASPTPSTPSTSPTLSPTPSASAPPSAPSSPSTAPASPRPSTSSGQPAVSADGSSSSGGSAAKGAAGALVVLALLGQGWVWLRRAG